MRNYQVQKEPRDAEILMRAALAANQPKAAQPALDWLRTSQYEDPAAGAAGCRAGCQRRDAMKRWLAFLLVLLLQDAGLGPQAQRQLPDPARRTQGSDDIAVRWDIALRDLDYVLELDRDGNGALTWGEVRQRTDDITRYATTPSRAGRRRQALPLGNAAVR